MNPKAVTNREFRYISAIGEDPFGLQTEKPRTALPIEVLLIRDARFFSHIACDARNEHRSIGNFRFNYSFEQFAPRRHQDRLEFFHSITENRCAEIDRMISERTRISFFNKVI